MTRRPEDPYQPFGGIVLTDTFELNPHQPPMPTMNANSQRARKQAELPIQVIVGNPPWSVGQRDAGGDNPNIPHPDLEERIRQTYTARSKAQLRRAPQTICTRWQYGGPLTASATAASSRSSHPTGSSTATSSQGCAPASPTNSPPSTSSTYEATHASKAKHGDAREAKSSAPRAA